MKSNQISTSIEIEHQTIDDIQQQQQAPLIKKSLTINNEHDDDLTVTVEQREQCSSE